MEYKLQKSADACASCAAEFEAGASLVSGVVLAEQGPQRRDWCIECFEKAAGEGEGGTERAPGGDELFAHWRTRKHEGTRQRRAVDFAALRELFFRMAARPGPEYRKLAYLMALILIRKRQVQLKEFVTQGGADYLVVTSKTRTEPLTIEAPELAAHEFADLRERLRYLLDLDPEQDLEFGGAGLGAAAAESAEPAEPVPPVEPDGGSEPPAAPESEDGAGGAAPAGADTAG